jgi:hypothetical protein
MRLALFINRPRSLAGPASPHLAGNDDIGASNYPARLPPHVDTCSLCKNKTLRGSLIDKAALQAVRGWKWSPDSETVTFYARREPRGGHPHPYGTDGLGIGHGGHARKALVARCCFRATGQRAGPRLGASPGPSVPDGFCILSCNDGWM